MVQRGKAFVNGSSYPQFNRNPDLAKDMSADEIAEQVFARINPMAGQKLGTLNNCRRCTFAYEMERRGYEVRATQSVGTTGQDFVGIRKALGEKDASKSRLLKNLKTTLAKDNFESESEKLVFAWGFAQASSDKVIDLSNKKNKAINVFDALSKMPNRSRGELSVRLLDSGNGHSMAWEIIDGKPYIFDCQRNISYKAPADFELFANRCYLAGIKRLDDKKLDFNFISRWVTNLF